MKKTPAQRRIDAAIVKAMKPAEVTLTVRKNSFVDVLAPTSCKLGPTGGNLSTVAAMRMDDRPRHPRVFIDKKEPNKLKIRSKGATIRFTIKPDGYYPIGIAFKLIKGEPNPDQLERLGILNFETAQMLRTMHTLTITDSFKDEGHDNQYKFSVVIQRARDCAIGIIDPDIVHES
jgi:hypothetical protein